jgi:hypothetical protein
LAKHRIQEDTLESLQQAVRLSPANALAQARLAFGALTNETKPNPRQMASSDWQGRRAVALSPNDPEVWWAWAQVCERLGRLTEALETMERGSRLNPTNPAFWNAWGLLLEKTNRVADALQAYDRAVEFSGPWKGPRTPPGLAWKNRSDLLKRQGDLAGATADNLKALNLMERHAETPPHLIDLSLHYNRRLELTGGLVDDFTLMPAGRVTQERIEFDVRGAIQLRSGHAAWDLDTPETVRGIVVRQKCRWLYFLHVGRAAVSPQDGVPVGLYRMQYADGQEVSMPIVYGKHLRSMSPWYDPKDPLDQGTKVGWEGTTPQSKQTIRLFLTAWENPRPDVAIESLDFVTSSNRVIPFLFAITAKP